MSDFTDDDVERAVAALWDKAAAQGHVHDESDSIRAVAEIVLAAVLPEHDKRVRAEVWHEGFRVGWDHCQDGNYGTDWWDDDTTSPYARADAEEGK
jgi:hypothetical protein